MHTTKHKAKSLLPALLMTLLVLSLSGCGKSPEEHLQDGKSLVEKGDYRAAVLELKSTLQEQPNNKEARLLLGQAYLSTAAYPEAEKELRKALEFGASQDQVLPGLARSLLQTGKAQEVVDLAIPPSGISGATLAELQTTRAEAFFSLKKPEEAQQAILAAEQADAQQPNLLLFKARLAASKQDLATARTLINSALSRHDKFMDGYFFLAALHEADKKPEEAMKAYEKIISLDSKAYRAHLAISDLQLRQGNKEASEKSLKAAEAAAPNIPMVKYSRGIFELRNNNLKAANEALQEVLKVAPDFLPAQLASAIANVGLGNYEQSMKAAKLVLAKDPDNVLAVRALAASQLKSGDPKVALSTLTPLLNSRPDDAQLLSIAGEAYLQSKNYTQALASINKAAALDPKNPAIKEQQVAGLLATGQTDLALDEMEKAVKLSDKAGRSDLAIVSIYLQRKEFQQALAAIDALEKKLPNSPVTHNLRGAALAGMNNMSGARQSFDKALAIDPKFFAAAANLARLDLIDKKPDAAKKRFESVLAKDEKNLQAMLALAELAALSNKEAEYVSWLDKAAKAHPQAIQPRALLSRYHLSKKDTGKALGDAQEALKNNPDDLNALNLLGTTQLASNEPKAALETFKRLATKAPESPDAQLRLALAQFSAKDMAAGRASLDKALKLNPGFIQAMDAYIRVEMSEKKLDAALAWAKKMQAAQNSLPVGFDREGDIQIAKENFAAAAKAYEQAMKRDNKTQSMIKLYAALTRAGNTKQASSTLDSWLKAHPSDTVARAFAAERAMIAGNLEQATSGYQTVLKAEPSNVTALNNLAVIYQKRKDARALETAEKAYKLAPKHPGIQDTLGWILLEQGQVARAEDLLKQAVTSAPKNPVLQYHYGAALAKAGKKAEARQALNAALAGNQPFAEQAAAKALLSTL